MKICFIFSKKAGGQRIGSISWEIRKYMERAGIEFEMEIAEYPGHVEEMARRASWADVVVAVGGDGTVNEVVNGIIGKGAALGIIPIGSGNGFARSLGIPFGQTPIEKLRKANGERRKKQIAKGGRRIAKMRNGELSFRNPFSQSAFRYPL
jgi:diacylglycerol kinase family enzyme